MLRIRPQKAAAYVDSKQHILSLSLWFHLLYWSTYNPFNPLKTLFLPLLFVSDHIFIIPPITGVMEMKQVQRDRMAMRTGGFSHRIIYTLWLSVRIWTISLQWPCGSLRGNEGLITYSTVRGQGAEKYRTSGRPLWTVEGGCNGLNGEIEGGPANF